MPEPRRADPLAPFLKGGGVLILDGGLATELEKRGCDLDHPLWSARLLQDDPAAIAAVHRTYLEAGADCIITASYQASFAGFAGLGVGAAGARDLLRRSVDIALEARDDFWSEPENRVGRTRPLVAASVGPYGAFLANGAEYTGDYDLGADGLAAFHGERLRVLAEAGADLLACETLPQAEEARVLVSLLESRPGIPAWLSFSGRDGEHVCDGTPFAEIVRELASSPAVAALGVNCTAPPHVESLLRAAAAVTPKPLLAYPNSGERYDARGRTWRGLVSADDWGTRACEWHAAGARLLGGCCRTGPEHVRALRAALSRSRPGSARTRSRSGP